MTDESPATNLLATINAELQRQKSTSRRGSNLIGPVEENGECSIDGTVNMLALAQVILEHAQKKEHEAGYRRGLEMAIRVGGRVQAQEENEYATGARFVVEAVERVLRGAA